MDGLVPGPGNGESSAAQDVAAVLAAVSLPVVEPFGPGSASLAGLPAFIPHPVPDPEPASRASTARAVQADTAAALDQLRVLESGLAAVKAALVARHLGAAAVEAAALALDRWQGGIAESAAVAEIGASLHIPESSARLLANQATELAAHRRDTLDALTAGELSWRHACTIVAETGTLAETPGTTPADTAAFEARLLAAVPGTTPGRFASAARRMREGTHPETLPTRTREAIGKRTMAVEPGTDGMAWLSLHLPAPAANGALAACTRLARAQQGPGEHRTLSQLRADTAAILLLGQHLPPTTTGTAVTAGDGAGADTGNGTAAGVGKGAAGAGGPVGELLGSLAGAVVEGMVDGVVEDPVGEYFAQLEATRAGLAVAEPPQPLAQVILTVPVLGLLGATNEPAILAGHGPIDEVTARKLLCGAGSFLRVLTDPVTAEPLTGVPPERYRLRDAEKALLRALAETCSFPGCTNPAMDTETDHLTAYALGGPTTPANSHALCKRHHAYKHFWGSPQVVDT
ncbi:hypothetical protein QO003_002060 [Arthrobacter silviterrae]|nr:HNH endonuclease signature motif containing protein [Arthrobacter silviterrae]MDQ0277757.1 hypothetical protein [Arthrobacter silviterrae]